MNRLSNKGTRFFLICALNSLTASSAYADTSACDAIEAACGKAGYIRGLKSDSDGKDLDKACLQPLMKGQDVNNVTVDPDTIKKCQEEQQPKSNSPGKHGHHRGG